MPDIFKKNGIRVKEPSKFLIQKTFSSSFSSQILFSYRNYTISIIEIIQSLISKVLLTISA